jgi:ATP-dependent Clp protease ATP-binding subunit ClpB
VLRSTFRPEFLNRVDDVIVFRPLTRDHLGAIVELQLERLRRQLAERRITLVLAAEARDLILAEGYDPVYGARPLKRVIQRRVQNPLALAILEGEYGEGDTVRVVRSASGNDLEFVPITGVAPDVASRPS